MTSMLEGSPEQAMEVAAEAARAGGRVLTATGHRELTVRHKQDHVDLTTSADTAAHQAIVEVLHDAAPSHAIFGEDGATGPADATRVWYVDALDGTSNYVHGVPCYAVSVALRYGREIVAAAVLDPMREELFLAGSGRGATCNGTALRVRPANRLDHVLVITQAQSTDPVVIARYVSLVKTLMGSTGGVRSPGSRALALCHVAAGQYGACCDPFMEPWDVAAGRLIVTEAGGRVTDFRGQTLGWEAPLDIVASNGLVHDSLLAALTTKTNAGYQSGRVRRNSAE